MNENAVHDFIFLTDLSFDYGLIDRTVYIERMVSLYEMTDVDPDFIKHIVTPYGQQFYYNLIENNHNGENDQSSYEGEFGSIIKKNESDDTILQYYQTNNSGKECRWEFYEKDADPHPSVSHGHGIIKIKLRLDPYRRCIFEKQNGLKQIGFEKRKYIIALWNDDNFRDYALRAIKNFISSGIVGQNYNWYGIRGIRNPYRLPRKGK